MGIGVAIGNLAYYLARRRRHIAEVNISLCFPEKTKIQRDSLVKQNFRSLGMGLMETATAWLRDPRDFQECFDIEGLDNLKDAVNKGKGVILLGFHFTSMDLAAAVLGTYVEFNAMYRKNKNQLTDKAMIYGREKNLAGVIEREDIKGVLRCLKKGGIVWYGPDQDYGRKHSVFAPFFGIQTATIGATSRLARVSKSAVIVYTQFRNPDNKTYSISLSEPLTDYPGPDAETDARRINELVEQAIIKHPEQYWWIHRRFKTRPEGEKRPY